MKPATWVEGRTRPLSFPGLSTFTLARGALLIALGFLIWIGLWQLRTPDVAPASTAGTAFSAERALTHLEAIGTESRAVGEPGHLAAREYLVEQIRAMGYEPEIQTAPAHVRFEGADGFSAGTVNNVVVRIPGTGNTGAIALNAHYDSGTTGPGVSDCGSCVVTVLETMRAVVAGPALRNDVVFVFSDAEEDGDLGAEAFVSQHPWARDVRLAVNYEAQGSGGPAMLYASSEDDGWIVSEFLDVAPNASAYSWIGAITELMPGSQLECDLAEYMKAGVQGIGFVYTANTYDYHTIRDNLDEIDLGSVQQEGDYTVAFVRHFGDMDLTTARTGDNLVFFNVLPDVVVHYAYGWVVPLAALITVLTAALVVVGFRQGEIQAGRLTLATVLLGFGTLLTIIVSAVLWFAIRSLNADYQVVLVGNYQTNIYTIALIFLTVALMGTLYALLRRLGTRNLLAGALVIWLPLLWLMSLVLPAMSYIATWPLLFGLLPLGWMLLGRKRAGNLWFRLGFLAVAAIPAIVLLPGTLYQAVGILNRLEGAGGMPVFGLAMLFVAPAVLLLMPHFDMLAGAEGKDRWIVPIATGLIAVGLIGWANATSGFDAEHPRPNHMSYVLDANTGQAEWVSFDQQLDSWTGKFVPSDTARAGYETVMWGTFQAFTAEAPTVDVAAPTVTVENDATDGGLRSLDLRITSPRGAPEMRVRVDAPGEIVSATLDGRELDLSDYQLAEEGTLQFGYTNTPAGGIKLTITVRSTDPVTITAQDSSTGFPEIPGATIEPRPADTMPAPLYRKNATEVLVEVSV
ncbi:MAG: M28 family peptidase [Thermomicrobiales bacterium]